MPTSRRFTLRRTRLWRTLRPQVPAALLLTAPPSVRYLCGFTGSSAGLVLTRRAAHFFTDGRYIAQAGEEVANARIHIENRPLAAALEWVKRSGLRRVGFEGGRTTFAEHQLFQRALGRRTRLTDIENALLTVRMVKDSPELTQMVAAARLGSSLFPVALSALTRARSEAEVAARMELHARLHGAEGMSFSTIVAAGRRSAMPHGHATTARLPRRGFVVLDFGVILSGYCSDMTRTVYLGQPGTRDRGIYAAVRRAQQAAIRAARPGHSFADVDAAAREALRAAKLERYFTHSTGHGVGLEIHEPPRLAAGQSGILRPGMVITVEPGVYIPGQGGVRIEDMVLVTARGPRVLTRGAKELIAIKRRS